MEILVYENRAEPKSISVIRYYCSSMLAAAGSIYKLRRIYRECYIFASQNPWLYNNKDFVKQRWFTPYLSYVIILI